jgi:vacuolar protein sorting-associated protein 13A/C
VKAPIQGAKEEGLAGFVKGVGRGIIGAAVKPTVGALDFATRTTQGIVSMVLFPNQPL